jgi:hypothetical protein
LLPGASHSDGDDLAFTETDEATVSDHSVGEAYYVRGLIYYRRFRHTLDSINALHDPENTETENYFYRATGLLRDAIQNLDRAVTLQFQRPYWLSAVYQTRGFAHASAYQFPPFYRKIGGQDQPDPAQCETAIQSFGQAIHLGFSSAENYTDRAQCEEALGARAAAEADRATAARVAQAH